MGIRPDLYLADEGLRDRLEAAKKTGIGQFTETELNQMSTNDLRELALAQGEEEKRQSDLLAQERAYKEHQIDQRFEKKSTEEIRQEFVNKTQQDEFQKSLENDPEVQLEKQA